MEKRLRILLCIISSLVTWPSPLLRWDSLLIFPVLNWVVFIATRVWFSSWIFWRRLSFLPASEISRCHLRSISVRHYPFSPHWRGSGSPFCNDDDDDLHSLLAASEAVVNCASARKSIMIHFHLVFILTYMNCSHIRSVMQPNPTIVSGRNIFYHPHPLQFLVAPSPHQSSSKTIHPTSCAHNLFVPMDNDFHIVFHTARVQNVQYTIPRSVRLLHPHDPLPPQSTLYTIHITCAFWLICDVPDFGRLARSSPCTYVEWKSQELG